MKISNGLAAFSKFSLESFKHLQNEHESSDAKAAFDKVQGQVGDADNGDQFKSSFIADAVALLKIELGISKGDEDKAQELSALMGQLTGITDAFISAAKSYEDQPSEVIEKMQFKAELKASLTDDKSDKDMMDLMLVLSANKPDEALEEGYEKYKEIELNNQDLPPEMQISEEDVNNIVKMTVITALMQIEKETEAKEKDQKEDDPAILEQFKKSVTGLAKVAVSKELSLHIEESKITITALDSRTDASVTVDFGKKEKEK